MEPTTPEPYDPDVDLLHPVPSRPAWRAEVPVVGVVAVGGALGATARYGAAVLWSTPDGAFPWTTFAVNVVGCAAIGVLMVLVSELWFVHRLVRPFLGTGVLGGFTTFSTYAADLHQLIEEGRSLVAFGYLVLTLVSALSAVWAAAWTTRRLFAGSAAR